MFNCLILGSGRSGTSMVAGTLSNAGYFFGNNLLKPRESNPKGFFEDVEINSINEAIVASLVPRRPPVVGNWLFRKRPAMGQRWLARVPVNAKVTASSEIRSRIAELTQLKPFCFKDPRFSYTLPIWRPFLANTVFVCVFRDPASTATSILKEATTQKYLKSFSISFCEALEVWTLMYSHILQTHIREGNWLFLHYNQVLRNERLDRLEEFVQAPVNRSFPESSLHRSFSNYTIPLRTEQIYLELCRLAEYQEEKVDVRIDHI